MSSYLSGPLLRSFSMRSFTFVAFAAAIARSVCNGMARAAPMMGAAVALSVFGTMNKSPVDAMHTEEGVRVGIPKGELAGASANWQAVIKTICTSTGPRVFWD